MPWLYSAIRAFLDALLAWITTFGSRPTVAEDGGIDPALEERLRNAIKNAAPPSTVDQHSVDPLPPDRRGAD